MMSETEPVPLSPGCAQVRFLNAPSPLLSEMTDCRVLSIVGQVSTAR